MENKYVYWHTGRAFLVACLVLPVALVAAGYALVSLRETPWSYVVAAVAILCAVWVPFVVDRMALKRGIGSAVDKTP